MWDVHPMFFILSVVRTGLSVAPSVLCVVLATLCEDVEILCNGWQMLIFVNISKVIWSFGKNFVNLQSNFAQYLPEGITK